MAPLEPTWSRPSHGDIQEVIITNNGEFTSKSLSKVRLSPFAVYAKMSFPPCTLAEEATYATVQIARDRHLNLNSDLLYINHSCQPSLIFDTANLNILAGPDGLEPGKELTFFYPSTEWHMAQPFDCICGEPTCRGRISGAKDMTEAQLEGVWLNGHIRELLEERNTGKKCKSQKANGTSLPANGVTSLEMSGQKTWTAADHQNEDATNGNQTTDDPTVNALRAAIQQAEKVVEAAKTALRSYMDSSAGHHSETHGGANGRKSGQYNTNGASASSQEAASLHGPAIETIGAATGSERRGPTSRELSGEMGGDTSRS